MRSNVRISLALLIALALSTSAQAQGPDQHPVSLSASAGAWFASLATSFSPGMTAGEAVQARTADEGEGVEERFTFTVPKAPESTLSENGRWRLVVNRWSTDEERDQVHRVVGEAETGKLLDALRGVGRVGFVEWPGGLEYTLRYARQTPRPDGGADLVLLADRNLWVWWDVKGAPATEAPFTVIQVRVDADGTGEGRVSHGTQVAADEGLGMTLPDEAALPVLLEDVRRDG